MGDQAIREPMSDAHVHALARRVMRLLEHRDEADLRIVFAALVRRVHPTAEGDRREAALQALERCAADLGVTAPTGRMYRAWRHTAEAGLGAPSMQQIRTLFDSWGRAVESMPSVPAPDPLALRLTAVPPKFTNAEALSALQRWHAETGAIDERSYKAWARRVRHAEPTARIPSNGYPLRRGFGSWPDALDAAGINRTPEPAARPSLPRRVHNATRQEVVDGLVMAYDELGEPFTGERYAMWVRRKAAEHGASDAPFRLASAGTVTRVMGCAMWGEAIVQVLGDRSDARTPAWRRARRFREAELRRAWWACRSNLDHAPSIREYESWRHSQAESTRFGVLPPSEGTIRSRYPRRSWQWICELFESEGPAAHEDDGDLTDEEQRDG